MITTDMLEQPVVIGSRLAVAFREGNQGTLRVGTVVGVSSRNEYWRQPITKRYEQQPRPTLVVEWEMTSGYRSTSKTTWIYQDVKRFVLIGESK